MNLDEIGLASNLFRSHHREPTQYPKSKVKPDQSPSQVEAFPTDKLPMVTEILSVISVLMFCLCCHQLIKASLQPIPILRTERPYARGAMLLGKTYKIISWAALTGSFLAGLVISFYRVYTEL
jgi:hypothetical protein